MKQLAIIDQLRSILMDFTGLESVVLIGSFARGNGGLKSDIDISLLVENPAFSPQALEEILAQKLAKPILKVLLLPKSKRLAVYFQALPKIDIQWYSVPEEMHRNILGSEIIDIETAIWMDKKGRIRKMLTTPNSKPLHSLEEQVRQQLLSFQYYFEQASFAHNRSDSYKHYYFYNIALQRAVQLKALAEGFYQHNYLPSFFGNRMLGKGEREAAYYHLNGTLFLGEANDQKRALLAFVYPVIDAFGFLSENEKQDFRTFTESIYERDYLWNFRDAAQLIPTMKPGKVMRASSLTRYQQESFFSALLAQNKIRTIVDLRSHDELKENPYDSDRIQGIHYVHIPIDPRIQSESFKAKHHIGTHVEIAYRFFGWECHAQIRHWMELLLNQENGAVLIHCFAGKDRTGFMIALLQLLLGADQEQVMLDYLASGMDSREKYLALVLEAVAEKGGIRPYLLHCGLSNQQLDQLKKQYHS